jgi:hypothetical protein
LNEVSPTNHFFKKIAEVFFGGVGSEPISRRALKAFMTSSDGWDRKAHATAPPNTTTKALKMDKGNII